MSIALYLIAWAILGIYLAEWLVDDFRSKRYNITVVVLSGPIVWILALIALRPTKKGK